jgi:hypothetical protein
LRVIQYLQLEVAVLQKAMHANIVQRKKSLDPINAINHLGSQ